jgi:hypothetical protein
MVVQVEQLLVPSKLITSTYQSYLDENIITGSIRLSKRVVELKEYGKAIVAADRR